MPSFKIPSPILDKDAKQLEKNGIAGSIVDLETYFEV